MKYAGASLGCYSTMHPIRRRHLDVPWPRWTRRSPQSPRIATIREFRVNRMTGFPTSARRRRKTASQPPAPLEDDDLLSEILLRLSPTPSSLPLASLVCKRWHRLISDHGFLRRFFVHHRHNPPLLGFLRSKLGEIFFTSILDPPDEIRRGRFWLSLDGRSDILSIRHGLVLIHDLSRLQLLVWDPVTFDQLWIPYPQLFFDDKAYGSWSVKGSVFRNAGNVNGGVGWSHFQAVLVGKDKGGKQAIASVYSSETGEWGDVISTPCPSMEPAVTSGVLVGGSVCWILGGPHSFGILEFDLDRQRLAVIEVPDGMSRWSYNFMIMQAEGGGLGILRLSSSSLEFWKRKTDVDAGWVLGRSVELDKILPLNLDGQTELSVYGYVDDNNTLLLTTTATMIFVIQLDSMQLQKSFEIFREDCGHPFSCVYSPGI